RNCMVIALLATCPVKGGRLTATTGLSILGDTMIHYILFLWINGLIPGRDTAGLNTSAERTIDECRTGEPMWQKLTEFSGGAKSCEYLDLCSVWHWRASVTGPSRGSCSSLCSSFPSPWRPSASR